MSDTFADGAPNREVVESDTNVAISLPRLLAVFLTTADLSILLHFFPLLLSLPLSLFNFLSS